MKAPVKTVCLVIILPMSQFTQQKSQTMIEQKAVSFDYSLIMDFIKKTAKRKSKWEI